MNLQQITTIYDPKEVNILCGERNIKYWKASFYAKPYMIEPTQGEHDYRTCEGCLKNRKIIIQNLTPKVIQFPHCCKWHEKLLKLEGFNRNDFINSAENCADKIIFTYQHILNNQNKEQDNENIIAYLDYVIDSFGAFPNGFGEPFLLSSYIYYVKQLVINNSSIEEKYQKLINNYFDKLKYPTKDKDPIALLCATYNKWLKLFPFQLPYFRDLKQYFMHKTPLFVKEVENNIDKKHKYMLCTVNDLTNHLTTLTIKLLTELSGKITPEKNDEFYSFYEEFLKQKLFYEIQLLKNIDENNSYIKIINKWMDSQERFLKGILLLHQTGQGSSVDRYPEDSYKEALYRVKKFKTHIEDKDIYKLLEGNNKENRLQKLFSLFCNHTDYCLDAEVNNGRGAVDFKISKGVHNQTLIEFKLASNSKIQQNLKNQTETYCKANETTNVVIVIFYFSHKEHEKITKILKKLNLLNKENYIIVNCIPNKPSASNIK